MFVVEIMLRGVVLPAVLAGAVLLVAWWPRKGGAGATGPVGGGHWGGAVGLALGYVLGHSLLVGFPSFPATESTQWLVWLALGAMALGLADALIRVPESARWAARAASSLLVSWLILRPLTVSTWNGALVSALWIGGAALAVLAFWTLVDRAVRARPGAGMPIAFLALTSGGSAVLLLSASVLLAQLAGVVAATLGAAMVLAFVRPDLSLERGAVPVVGVLLPALWLNGYFYAEMPLASALLLTLAPAALWLGRLGPLRDLRRWKSAIAHVGAVLAPVLLALGLALASQPGASGSAPDTAGDPADPYDYGSYYRTVGDGE